MRPPVGRWLRVLLLLASVLAWQSVAAQPAGKYVAERGEILQSVMHKIMDENRTVAGQRTPLFELWTATWCLPCGPAENATGRMLDVLVPGFRLDDGAQGYARYDESGPEKAENAISFLAYHPISIGRPSENDPFGFPEGAARIMDKYGDAYFPSVWVDGILEDEAKRRDPTWTGGLADLHLDTYRRLVSDAGDRPSPFVLEVQTRIEGDEAVVDVRATPLRRVASPLVLTGALWEDGLRYTGENGVDLHRFTVRAMLPQERDGNGLDVDEPWTVTWRVSLEDVISPRRAGITVFIEDDWRYSVDPLQGRMIAFLAAAGVVSLAFLLMVRYEKRRRKGAGEGEA